MKNPLAASLALLAGTFLATGAHAGPNVAPSPELLQKLGISEYQISDQVKVSLDYKEKRVSNQGHPLCENSRIVSLRASSNLFNVEKLKVAVESEENTNPTALFSYTNDSPTNSKYNYVRSTADLHAYDGQVMNLWAFFYTPNGVYANYTKAVCILPCSP